jgi:phospholipid/cholesterol/gamma-HCH transport system permease protein
MSPLATLQGLLAATGRATLGVMSGAGATAIFAAQGAAAAFRPPFYPGETLGQLFRIGWLSLPVVGLTALFTGAALALQIYAGGARFNAASFVPSIVAIGMTRELGPVLGGLMVAGRVSASIAAELGTMRVTEQIDALTTLSTDPMRYLVAPRLVAATLALPLLVLVGDAIGIAGGFLVGVARLDFTPAVYLGATADFLELWDVLSGLIKAAVFGFIIALMGCWQGYRSRGGAQGVGRATTNAVVAASILILASNYLLTEFFFART